MQIVIEIPTQDYQDYINYADVILDAATFISDKHRRLLVSVLNGTPLPKGLIPITDVMSVFDDFMCGDVDEDGTNTFYEMLKEKVVGADEN